MGWRQAMQVRHANERCKLERYAQGTDVIDRGTAARASPLIKTQRKHALENSHESLAHRAKTLIVATRIYFRHRRSSSNKRTSAEITAAMPVSVAGSITIASIQQKTEEATGLN
jgi:hypothetical protein